MKTIFRFSMDTWVFIFFVLVGSLMCWAIIPSEQEQQQQIPVEYSADLEPEIQTINNAWELVEETPSLIIELSAQFPELFRHLTKENPNCTACKAKALLWCMKHSDNWADTVGECLEESELEESIISYYANDYGNL